MQNLDYQFEFVPLLRLYNLASNAIIYESTNFTMQTIIFINVRSIQNYVFNTNKLKHAIGASHIVKNVFSYFMQYGEDSKELNTDFKVGYIGGGKALLIFKDNSTAEEQIRLFTKNILIKYPGLVFGIGQHDVNDINNIRDKEYKSLMSTLVKNAAKKLNEHYPITNILKHGITADCPYSGLSAEIFNDATKHYISCSAGAKVDNKLWGQICEDDNSLLKKADFDENYHFASEFKDMGQIRGLDSHIAIVHIDGNDIGKRFRDCKNLEAAKELSDDTKHIIEESFILVLKDVKNNIDKKLIIPVKSADKLILPLRPIILGGDDITFVCNSTLGIWIAERFMNHFSSIKVDKNSPVFTACAGVCITKTKYPFYRGYKLAEELCLNAKEIYRVNNKEGNWLDFHLAQTDISEDLTQIRKSQYIDADGESLLKRPYNTSDLTQAITDTIMLSNELPKGWIKELREVLYEGKVAWEFWRKKANWRKKNFKLNDKENVEFKNKYYDLIELHEIIDMKLYANHQSDKHEEL